MAYLRVYRPLGDFTGLKAHMSEPQLGLCQSRFGLLNESLTEDGLVTEWDGERYMCPRHTHLRVLEGVLAFHNALGENGLIIPEATARVAAGELARLMDRRPELRSHILTSPWHVPPRWFLAFSGDERELLESGAGVSLRYRTRRLSASGRLRRAMAALERVGFADAVIGEIDDLSDWLSDFREDALVELDYGTVARMFPDEDLVLDDSAAQIWEAVEALEAGDLVSARTLYIGMAARWSEAMAVGFHS